MQKHRSLGLRFAALFLLITGCSFADQTAPAPGTPATTASQPATLPANLSGISGPGVPWGKAPPRTFNARPAAGSAVKAGLIPPITPLLDVHIRDTVICLGGDGNYYMTGSTGDDIWQGNDGVELWRSPDLKTWEYLGLVWETRKDGTWEKTPQMLHDKPVVSIWAPEIHYVKKNYFICLSMAPSGITLLKSTSGKPTGPYVNALGDGKKLANGIDPTLFEDDDGKVYFTYSGASRIGLMKDDMSGLAEPLHNITLTDPDHDAKHHAAKCIARGSNDIGHEGASLFKANGKYYLGAVDDWEGRYSSVVAISDSIYGPYHTRHEAVPCGGGTDYFKDKNNQWWCCFFGNDGQAPWREKPAIIAVDFDKDGKIKVADKQPFAGGDQWRPKTP